MLYPSPARQIGRADAGGALALRGQALQVLSPPRMPVAQRAVGKRDGDVNPVAAMEAPGPVATERRLHKIEGLVLPLLP